MLFFLTNFITLKVKYFNKIQATYMGPTHFNTPIHVIPTVRKKFNYQYMILKKMDIFFNTHKYSVEFYTVQFGKPRLEPYSPLNKCGFNLMSLDVMSSHTVQMDMAMKLTRQSNLTETKITRLLKFYHTTAVFYKGSKLGSGAQEILLTFCQYS